jgi:hypothetical protein
MPEIWDIEIPDLDTLVEVFKIRNAKNVSVPEPNNPEQTQVLYGEYLVAVYQDGTSRVWERLLAPVSNPFYQIAGWQAQEVVECPDLQWEDGELSPR